MSEYYLNYIKYKNKFINITGGKIEQKNRVRFNELLIKYNKNHTNYTYCDERGFKQHDHECWNDTIQTFFCFSDAFKNQVQKKLWNLTSNEIIEFAMLKNRYKYLPYTYKYDKQRLTDLISKLTNYIQLLQERLCIYVRRDSSGIIPKLCLTIENECPIIDPNKIFTKKNESRRLGIKAAVIGITIEENKTRENIEDKHYGDSHIELLLSNLLSTIFIDDPYVIKTNNFKIKYLTSELLSTTECIYITTFKKDENVGHLVGFYKCNNKLYYYDNNNGRYEFNWKQYLKYYIDNNNIYIPVINYSSEYILPFFQKISDNKYYAYNNSELKELIINDKIIYEIDIITVLEKIIINSEIEYINICSQNLIDIELYNNNYNNIIKYYENGLNKNNKYDIYNDYCNIIQYLFSKKCYDFELIKYLVETVKVPLNNKDSYGYTELHSCYNKEIFEYLLNSGSNILSITDNNRSVLFIIARSSNNLELIKFICQKLTEKKINIKELPDLNDLLNILIEYDNIEIYKFLVETYKLKKNIIDSIIHKSIKIFNYIITPESLRIKDSSGSNLLHIAVQYENVNAILKLYELSEKQKISLNYKNLNGKLPIDMTTNKKIQKYIK
jgi:hypothetical protein